MTRIPVSRRRFLQGAGLAAGSLAVTRYFPAALHAQAQAAPTEGSAAIRAQMGAAPIQAVKMTDRLTLLQGPGGNVTVLHGPDGKLLVDTFVQPAWPHLQQALDALGPGPITTVIDSHWHVDHVDNNENLRKAGAVIIGHVNTPKRMAEPHEMLGMHWDPLPASLAPTETFADTKTLHMNGERIDLAHVAPAHTDTDLQIHFVDGNVLHMADTFFNPIYPFIDTSTHGNIDGMIAAAHRGLKLADSKTKIVPGHGTLGDRAALQKYVDVITTVTERVRKLKKEGKSLQEVQAAKPGGEFDATWGAGFIPAPVFVQAVYETV